ncbi:MAG: sugar nucleotide-binding protein [Bacteroidales bacterium]|nr:sugar nucleotide-binding protein [Bacteroidales bacterium]
MLTFSTDQVFNGKKKEPYVEQDPTAPLNKYGESKKKAEELVLQINSNALIIRSSYFFNPWNPNDFINTLLKIHDNRKEIYFASDIIISPTYIPDFVNMALDLLIDNESGIWHLSGPDEMSHFSFRCWRWKLPVRATTISFHYPMKNSIMLQNDQPNSVLKKFSGNCSSSDKTKVIGLHERIKS